MCTVYMLDAFEGQKRVPHPLELELQMGTRRLRKECWEKGSELKKTGTQRQKQTKKHLWRRSVVPALGQGFSGLHWLASSVP